jgi:hypothetical protein
VAGDEDPFAENDFERLQLKESTLKKIGVQEDRKGTFKFAYAPSRSELIWWREPEEELDPHVTGDNRISNS